nr:glycosyltransferase family 1 protein [Lederbergia wuyishanensis]
MNRGGAETLIMNLYRNIDRSKIQFDFLTCKQGDYDKEIISLGGRIHRIPYISEVGHFKYKKELNHFFLKNSQYTIVHSHLDKMSGFVLNAAKKACIPVRISHSHSTRSEGGYIARLYKWFSGKLLQKSATHLIACSEHAAKWLFPRDYKNAKVLKNGIDTSKFAFSKEMRKIVRKELEIEDNFFVIGHVGRFSHVKNHRLLIEVFAKLHKNNQNSILILAGDGPLKSSIQKRVKELNLHKNVKFIGIRNDIERILQALDVFVFPSFYEGVPVSLIEAQAAGLPCIISDQITRDIDLDLNLINFVPLNDPIIWVDRIMEKVSVIQRASFDSNVFLNKGFDIKSTAKHMTDYYFKCNEVSTLENTNYIYADI